VNEKELVKYFAKLILAVLFSWGLIKFLEFTGKLPPRESNAVQVEK